MKVAEFVEKMADMLNPGEWLEVYLEDEDPFMRRRFYCGDCGQWNTYGRTPFCPYCGKKKVNVEVEA